MNYQEFLKKGLLRKEKISFEQTDKVLEKAYRNIECAKILMKNNHQEGGFKFAYEAMLLAGRALVFSYGLRPRTVGSHKVVLDFADKVLGNQHRVLTKKFDKMRRKRHYLIYGIGLTISMTEAENAIKSAKDFIKEVKKHIQARSPQKKLL